MTQWQKHGVLTLVAGLSISSALSKKNHWKDSHSVNGEWDSLEPLRFGTTIRSKVNMHGDGDAELMMLTDCVTCLHDHCAEARLVGNVAERSTAGAVSSPVRRSCIIVGQ